MSADNSISTDSAALADELERLHRISDETFDGQPDGYSKTQAAFDEHVENNFATILVALRCAAQKVQEPAMNVEDARRLANKVQDYIFQNDPFGDIFSQKDLQDVYIAIVAGPLAQVAPETDQTEHGADGKFRPAALRTKLARTALSVLNNPDGVETLDWQIADAVLAALPSPPAPLQAGEVLQRPHSIYSQFHLDNWTDDDFASHAAATRKTLEWLLKLEASLASPPPVQVAGK